jgi:hypothetical protein
MTSPQTPTPEKYMVAFVIQGDSVFKITADSIIQAQGGAAGLASFDGIAKLKAAAALVELTNQHNERPEELRQMAREMASEGMRLLARAGAGGRVVVSAPQPVATVNAPPNAASNEVKIA